VYRGNVKENTLLKFGHTLRKTRMLSGVSQEDLANAAGLDRTYISLLERGKRNPSLTCIVKLCQILKANLLTDTLDLRRGPP
jgi:transcriptional regulator with XRE-family HTH domain